MVGPKLSMRIRGELFNASEQATSVGDFHRRIAEIASKRSADISICQLDGDGNVFHEFVIDRESLTSVLRHQNGQLVKTYMFKVILNQMTQDPSITHPSDATRKVVYDLLSSAMRTAKGEKVDGVSIVL